MFAKLLSWLYRQAWFVVYRERVRNLPTFWKRYSFSIVTLGSMLMLARELTTCWRVLSVYIQKQVSNMKLLGFSETYKNFSPCNLILSTSLLQRQWFYRNKFLKAHRITLVRLSVWKNVSSSLLTQLEFYVKIYKT